jgi:phosphoglycolate phosphatase
MQNAVFFDLDGTLWDATESTARAWTDVFSRYKLDTTVTKHQIQEVAGRPYLECLQFICPNALNHADSSSLMFDLAAAEKEWMHRVPGYIYAGALDAVAEIARRCHVFLVSNCNDWYLEAFLDHSRFRGVFHDVICYGSTKNPKANNILYLMGKHGVSKGLYVGDTKGDMEASRQAGIGYIHAAFGFGGPYIENSLHTLSSFEPTAEFVVTIHKCFSMLES